MVMRPKWSISAVSGVSCHEPCGRFHLGIVKATGTLELRTKPSDGWRSGRSPGHGGPATGGGQHGPARVELALPWADTAVSHPGALVSGA